ncbi:MAG: caspase family protein [Pseudomonadota bacterium]
MITLRTRLPALIAAVLATGIAPALADGHQSPTRRALLIAIDDYANVTDLRGTVNDVERVRSVLSSRFDFPDANIRTLTNRDATRDGILEAIRDHLIEPSAPGDIVVLHYSGHGSQMRDVNGDEIDGWDETLVPHDSRAAGIFDISDDELNALLAELGRKTDNITVIFDSCHSGSATRAAAGRRVERDEREPPGAPASRGGDASAEMRPPGANYVLISGARSNELANETTIDGKTFGAMSFALTEALLAGGGTMTYRDLMDEVGIRVSSEYRLQHPQLEGSGLDTLVFGVATRATEAYVLVNPDGGGKVEVSGGSLLGLARNDVLRVFAPRTSDFAGGEPVATVRLDRVGALTSRGSIESGGPVAAASRATLAGAVVGDSTLRVWIDDSSDRDTARALRRELRAAGSIEFVDENAADVWVAPAEGGLAVHGRDGTVLSPPVMPGSGDAAPRLADQLFGWARWYALLRLDNPNPGVTVDFSLHRPGDPAGAPAPASITDGSVLEYRVTNTSRKDLYIATLNLSSDGSVGVLYPPPGAQEPLPPGRTDVQQIRFRVPDERRSVVDVLKVIATDKPLNAAVLQQSAVRGEPRELPDDPLSQLIAAAVLGQTRAAANVTVSLDDWAVAARSVEIERSDARTVGFALHVDDTLTVTRSLCGGPDAPPNCVPAEPLPGDASILQSPVSGTRGVDDAFSPGAAFEAAYELRDRTGADRVEPLFEFEMPAAEPAPAGTRSGGHSETHDPAAAANDFWSLDYVRAPRAWARVRGATGKTEGNEAAGIVVAHPDTGYRHHPEVWTEIDGRRPILHEHGIDYVDGDGDAFDPLIRDARLDNPGHGTASGSVIVSPAGCQLDDTEKCVNGIGRGAQLIPLRVNTSVVVVNQKKLARAILDTADGRLGREAQMMSIPWAGRRAGRCTRPSRRPKRTEC